MNLRTVIGRLKDGPVTFVAHGGSMSPRIRDGATVTVEPLAADAPLKRHDVVLAQVGGQVYLHLVKAVEKDRILIGNNRGGINGWTSRDRVYGKLV